MPSGQRLKASPKIQDRCHSSPLHLTLAWKLWSGQTDKKQETGKEEARLFADDMIMQAEGMPTNTQAIRLDELVHRCCRIQKQYIRISILYFVFLYPRRE